MQITVYSSWKIFCLAYFLEGSMQENDFFHWYSMLTNNAIKQNISFGNLLNQIEAGNMTCCFAIVRSMQV